ncbi:MAG TPA: flagellar basal body-associated FliL family protein [Desulfitobacteriaceae bacterium]|jgi:flagellar FliL protein|nr:flagellar basal body-associated FliL family protein [Desulfitobacteriaceae bacterium]
MSKKAVLLIIVMFVIGIGLGTGGTLTAQKYLSPAKNKAEVARNKPVQSDMPVDYGGPLVSIGEFTLNLKEGSYLRTQITVEGADAKAGEYLEEKIAFLKDAVNVVLSNKSVADIQTIESREKLRQELLLKLNAVTDEKVSNVLFESFVYQ